MSSIKDVALRALLIENSRLNKLPAELHLQLVHTMIDARHDDSLASLGQVNMYWRQLTRTEHPWLKPTSASEDRRTVNYVDQLESLVRANSPKFLARFCVEVEDRDRPVLAKAMNCLTSDSLSPLMLAAHLGLSGIAEVLLTAGSDVTRCDPVERNAVVWAYEGGNRKLAERLLGNFVTRYDHQPGLRLPRAADVKDVSLSESVKAGHRLLIRENLAKPEAVATEQHLCDAACSPSPVPVAKMLLDFAPEIISGAEPATVRAIRSMPDPLPWIQLMMSHAGHHLDSDSLLHATAKAEKFPAFEYVFAKYGTTAINQSDRDGFTFFYRAASAGQERVVETLLSAGADHRTGPANSLLLPNVVFNVVEFKTTIENGAYYTRCLGTPSVGHIAVASRLLGLEWPRDHLDAALVSAKKEEERIRTRPGAEKARAALANLIQVLESKGASIPLPPAPAPAPVKKSRWPKFLFN